VVGFRYRIDKMKTVILPDYPGSSGNWAYNVADNLKTEGEAWPIIWDKYGDQEAFLPNEKADKIASILGTSGVDIIARDGGCLVGAILITRVPKQVGKVIFCGIPVDKLNPNGKEAFSEAFSLVAPENILCIQNENGSAAGLSQVEEFLRQLRPGISLLKKLGVTEDYNYYDDFQTFLGKR
jgi:pimeloyl-ACP methyl ester carboxylesterase